MLEDVVDGVLGIFSLRTFALLAVSLSCGFLLLLHGEQSKDEVIEIVALLPVGVKDIFFAEGIPSVLSEDSDNFLKTAKQRHNNNNAKTEANIIKCLIWQHNNMHTYLLRCCVVCVLLSFQPSSASCRSTSIPAPELSPPWRAFLLFPVLHLFLWGRGRTLLL